MSFLYSARKAGEWSLGTRLTSVCIYFLCSTPVKTLLEVPSINTEANLLCVNKNSGIGYSHVSKIDVSCLKKR